MARLTRKSGASARLLLITIAACPCAPMCAHAWPVIPPRTVRELACKHDCMVVVDAGTEAKADKREERRGCGEAWANGCGEACANPSTARPTSSTQIAGP